MTEAVNIDFDRLTGLALVGWPAVAQSLREIFVTDYGLRVQREWFGSFVPRALGRTISAELVMALSSSIATSIDRFEPRFHVVKIVPTSANRLGILGLEVEGEYRPGALLGDDTGFGLKKITVGVATQTGQVTEVET